MTSGGDSTIPSRIARITRPLLTQRSRQIRPDLALRLEQTCALLVVDELDAGEQADAADLADQRMVRTASAAGAEVRTDRSGGTRGQALLLDDLDVLQRHGAAQTGWPA